MSINVQSYVSKYNIWVAYASQNCNVQAFALYEEHPDGQMTQLSPTSFSADVSYFAQGSEDIIGNNSVVHSHLEGDLVILPESTSKKFVRSVTTESPSSYMKEYYMEHIATSDTWGEGSCHYIIDNPGNFFIDRTHTLYERDWSFQTVSVRTYCYPDHHARESDIKNFFHVEFPELKRSDICYQNTFHYYYSNKTAVAKTFSEAGVLIDSRQPSLGMISFGRLTYSDRSKILNLLRVPVAGGPVPPDNLLTKLTKKIGSLKVNNLANIAQLRRLNELLPPAVKKTSKVFKTAADFLLWYKYSYKTTNMDIEEMMKYYLRAEGPVVGESKKGYSHRTTISNVVDDCTTDRFTFYLGSYQQSIFQKFGLQLNLGNTWDLIPFSFVVDWFLKIGDTLESLDAIDEWVQVPLICYVASRKSSHPYRLPEEISSATGNLTTKFYSREVSRNLPMTIVSPSLNLPRGNILTALSLVIANKR